MTSRTTMTVDLTTPGDPIALDRYGVGQGGFDARPMFDAHVDAVRALEPRIIRMFAADYLQLSPGRGEWDWSRLDAVVDTVLATGAVPMFAIVLKPGWLFPGGRQDEVVPTSWQDWEDFIAAVANRYRARSDQPFHWEVGNEPDLATGGGSPYTFRPEEYVEFYAHTVAGVRAGDPDAKVGGPALAHWNSPILSRLLEACVDRDLPLDFVSWHGYHSDIDTFRAGIDGVKAALAAHPGLSPQLVISEWSMDLDDVRRPRGWSEAFLAEATLLFLESGLDHTGYYQIRDFPFSREGFAPMVTPELFRLLCRIWELRPTKLGLFDILGRARPKYHAQWMISRVRGLRLPLVADGAVHGLAASDPELGTTGVVVWNSADAPATVRIELRGTAGDRALTVFGLDCDPAAGDDPWDRVPVLDSGRAEPGTTVRELELEPYAMRYLLLEQDMSAFQWVRPVEDE